MNHTPVKLGPLALLLTVISICLTILSILSFTTASADVRLAEKYADTVSRRYALETQGQHALKDLSDELASGSEVSGFDLKEGGSGDILTKEIEDDDMSLLIEVRVDGKDYEVVSWKFRHDWVQKETIDNLWPGGSGN